MQLAAGEERGFSGYAPLYGQLVYIVHRPDYLQSILCNFHYCNVEIGRKKGNAEQDGLQQF